VTEHRPITEDALVGRRIVAVDLEAGQLILSSGDD
jgi:hypothetical protein